MSETGISVPPRRLAVVGAGGAGKSTLSARLGAALDLPVIDLDRAFADTDSPTSRAAVVAELVRGDRWILDGDHLPTQPERFRAADTIVLLDLATLVCFWRVVRRALENRGARRGRGTAGRPLGGRWRTAGWVLGYRSRCRPLVLRNLARHAASKQVIVVRTAKAATSLPAALAAPANGR